MHQSLSKDANEIISLLNAITKTIKNKSITA